MRVSLGRPLTGVVFPPPALEGAERVLRPRAPGAWHPRAGRDAELCREGRRGFSLGFNFSLPLELEPQEAAARQWVSPQPLLSLLTRAQSPEVQARAARGSTQGKHATALPPLVLEPETLPPFALEAGQAEVAPERHVCCPLRTLAEPCVGRGRRGPMACSGQTSLSPLTTGEADRLPAGCLSAARGFVCGMRLVALLNPSCSRPLPPGPRAVTPQSLP